MGVYHSRNALAGPLTPDRLAAVELHRTPLGRRGYRPDDVDALLHRLAYEIGERIRQRDQVWEENRRLKHALRTWQSEHATTRHER
ncbi:DivIVA domain-containing protein [Micromonospora nigra]|uniref:DivIVA domain-containing protein n=1 Tax=Micromonospora nigra TaxID=145857 RepID=A0A1C6RGA3_9ACTN|nr:DivIVA domain-containing protein [Micromonospora nigra]SCL16210.1 DivIVA domain-containing protein [Micromonospora nigra]